MRGGAYGMRSETIDGNDLFVVHEAVAEAAERAAPGEGPTFIEALTYRHKGHSRTDPAKYRPRASSSGGSNATRSLLLARARSASEGIEEDDSRAIRSCRPRPP